MVGNSRVSQTPVLSIKADFKIKSEILSVFLWKPARQRLNMAEASEREQQFIPRYVTHTVVISRICLYSVLLSKSGSILILTQKKRAKSCRAGLCKGLRAGAACAGACWQAACGSSARGRALRACRLRNVGRVPL